VEKPRGQPLFSPPPGSPPRGRAPLPYQGDQLHTLIPIRSKVTNPDPRITYTHVTLDPRVTYNPTGITFDLLNPEGVQEENKERGKQPPDNRQVRVFLMSPGVNTFLF